MERPDPLGRLAPPDPLDRLDQREPLELRGQPDPPGQPVPPGPPDRLDPPEPTEWTELPGRKDLRVQLAQRDQPVLVGRLNTGTSLISVLKQFHWRPM